MALRIHGQTGITEVSIVMHSDNAVGIYVGPEGFYVAEVVEDKDSGRVYLRLAKGLRDQDTIFELQKDEYIKVVKE